jgi:hypothetical protein
MAAKGWLQDRWEMLFPILAGLGYEQEEERARVCEEEIAYWRSRPTMKALSSLGKPMTETRNAIKQRLALTEQNRYLNPKTEQREHLALKYLNFTQEEWRAISAPSAAKAQARLEAQQTIADPDAVVSKGRALLKSPSWPDRVVALALLVGRRLSEVLGPQSDLAPKTLSSVSFAGQLKRRDKILRPYEVPTLAQASEVLEAWRGVRDHREWKGVRPDEINACYGPQVIEAAQRQFSGLVPPRLGGDLYTHLFRAVYGTIAVFYYCPSWVEELTYLNTILGHYWIDEDAIQQRDYAATFHYHDSQISDEAVLKHQGKRKGVRLGDPVVHLLNCPLVDSEKPLVVREDDVEGENEAAQPLGEYVQR